MRAYRWGVSENVTTPFLVSAAPMRHPTVRGCGCHDNVSCVAGKRTRGSIKLSLYKMLRRIVSDCQNGCRSLFKAFISLPLCLPPECKLHLRITAAFASNMHNSVSAKLSRHYYIDTQGVHYIAEKGRLKSCCFFATSMKFTFGLWN